MVYQQKTMSDSFNKTGYVYLLASKTAGTIYLGMTSDLIGRVAKHKAEIYDGFSKEHHTHRLVYYEDCGSVEAAILREKKLKKWRREWKIKLIEKTNPSWNDLYPRLARYI